MRNAFNLSLALCLLGTCGAKQFKKLDQFVDTAGWKRVKTGTVSKKNPQHFQLIEGMGDLFSNGAVKNKASYLSTKDTFGDQEIRVEFMIPKGANSGFYVQGRYEIQVLDSYGKEKVGSGDMGGLYARYDPRREKQGKSTHFDGRGPNVNAALAAGEWNKLNIKFKAPRFSRGKKVSNARFIEVVLNGKIVHSNVVATGPTASHPLKGESQKGPLVIQGDHGPIVFRDLEVVERNFTDASDLPYFTLPWFERNYDRWGTEIKRPALTEAQIKQLPSRVDNSQTEAWHHVGNQGKTNCCSQEGSVAGMLAYELNALRGSNAKEAENRLPAHFSWNIFNRAKNSGMEMIHGLETAYEVGIPSQKHYGGRYNKTIGYWPNGYKIWHNAMKNRAAAYDFMKVDTPESLLLAKAWMYNHAGWVKSSGGGMLAIDGTNVWKAPVKEIAKDEHEAGKKVWTDWGETYGGHVMCVVGYDDKVGYDVNGDGKISNDVDINGDGEVTLADHERGAFIVANSWGKKWGDDGKIYVLYRCLVTRRSFWDRGPFMGYVVPKNNQPRLTLRIKAQHEKRNALGMKFVLTNAAGKSHSWEPKVMFQKKAGEVPLGGPGTEGKSFEWGIDLTRMVEAHANEEGVEQLLGQLEKGKAKLEVYFQQKSEQGKLEEVELMFWSAKDELKESKKLLSEPKAWPKRLVLEHSN